MSAPPEGVKDLGIPGSEEEEGGGRHAATSFSEGFPEAALSTAPYVPLDPTGWSLAGVGEAGVLLLRKKG